MEDKEFVVINKVCDVIYFTLKIQYMICLILGYLMHTQCTQGRPVVFQFGVTINLELVLNLILVKFIEKYLMRCLLNSNL